MDRIFPSLDSAIRQVPLKACHGRTMVFREAVFTKPGVTLKSYSICDWCALNGCSTGPLEITIHPGTYSCNCTVEHAVVAPPDALYQQTDFWTLRSELRDIGLNCTLDEEVEIRQKIRRFRSRFSLTESQVIGQVLKDPSSLTIAENAASESCLIKE